jgi:hypothetical protein
VLSTRLGAIAWLPLLSPPAGWDPSPTGDWELAISSDPDTRTALRSNAVTDLLLVFSYRADLPPWPVSGT